MARYTIGRAESGKKLHRFLRQWLPGMPLGAIHKALRTGNVRVNDARAPADQVLREGDVVRWDRAGEDVTRHRAPDPGIPARGPGIPAHVPRLPGHTADLEILYEDGDLLVLNKPAGLLTHGDRPGAQDTLIDRVLAHLQGRGELTGREVIRPAAAHRLDRNTSGLVLVGKNAAALRELTQAIREHRLRKEYLAIVEGHLPVGGELRDTLVRDSAARRTRVVAAAPPAADPARAARADGSHRDRGQASRPALARYRTLDARHGFSLVEVELVTGRTHQIRAQFAAAGHPLLADRKYGGRPAHGCIFPLLHAHTVRLPDGREFTAPLPAPFRHALQQIGLIGLKL